MYCGQLPKLCVTSKVICLPLTACVLVAACGSSPDEVASETSPVDPILLQDGSEVYQAHCAECHGVDLRGSDKGPSFLSDIYEPNHHADAAFLLAVQRGVSRHHWDFGDMPKVEGLTPEDVQAIVAFVRETQRIEGFDP